MSAPSIVVPLPTRAARDLRDIAAKNGCKPVWWDGILGWAYHCTCEDELHFGDQQCSVITSKSARRVR